MLADTDEEFFDSPIKVIEKQVKARMEFLKAQYEELARENLIKATISLTVSSLECEDKDKSAIATITNNILHAYPKIQDIKANELLIPFIVNVARKIHEIILEEIPKEFRDG